MSIVKRLKIGPILTKCVIRHIWEKDKSLTNYEVWSMKRRQELGIWFNRSRAVGPVKKGKDRSETVNNTFNENNLVNVYQVGFKLIICTIWFEIQFRPTMGLKV